MSGFIERLEKMNKNDTKVRAVLRRSLAFDPGQYIPAFTYVEPFVRDESSRWRREAHYLVAGLWAAHWREGQYGEPMLLGKACAEYQMKSGSTSIERRFIILLDADREQLPHRLRQILSLLKEQAIDFDNLLKGILKWNKDKKPTQNEWARDFYWHLPAKHGVDIKTSLEETSI